jgi:flagellar biogenesis protein FliO
VTIAASHGWGSTQVLMILALVLLLALILLPGLLSRRLSRQGEQ